MSDVADNSAYEVKTDVLILPCPETIIDSPEIERYKTSLQAIPSPKIILDLSNVQEVTTKGLASLLKLKYNQKRSGKELYIQGLQGQPKTLCQLLKLCGLLE
jgi:ABC-type transporter Mla MlaB component